MSTQPEVVKVLRLLVAKATWADESEAELANALLATLDGSAPTPSAGADTGPAPGVQGSPAPAPVLQTAPPAEPALPFS